MSRPRVICHMVASIDGRIVTAAWPAAEDIHSEYERTAATHAADAWMCGRVTMEPLAGAVRDPAAVTHRTAGQAPADFLAPGAHPPYAVAVDPSGRLSWQTNAIDGDHVVAALADTVSDDYLAALRARRVSYLLAPTCGAPAGTGGEVGLDLAVGLEKLATTFGVRTLLLGGGGRINGAMLRAGLVDEVSLLIAPVADGTIGTPTVFDTERSGHPSQRLALETVERRPGDVLWLRYRVVPGE